MLRTRPACEDDQRFIRDEQTADDANDMRGLCASCPLRQYCEAAVKAMPTPAGWWAGRQYGRRSR
ncbi:WhiB family transcriptional regulator [Microbacterium sp. E-13]|uniref:WhiB family transcriptional regulator n=1 Tax=Microbacterium sp. E-13 TaxID=3404048 RepID=UPI003CEB8BB3